MLIEHHLKNIYDPFDCTMFTTLMFMSRWWVSVVSSEQRPMNIKTMKISFERLKGNSAKYSYCTRKSILFYNNYTILSQDVLAIKAPCMQESSLV